MGVSLILIFMVLAAFAALWFFGESAIAPAHSPVSADQTDLPVQSIQLNTESGSIVRGWSVRAEQDRATVVLLHPIRGSRLTMLSRARLLYQHGYSVVMIDLQAHGESPGDAITLGFEERHGAAAAVQFAKTFCDGKPVIVLGYSLGGASYLLSGETDVDGVILESVYPTISEAIFDRTKARVGSIAATPISATLLLQMEWRLGLSRNDLRPIDAVPQLQCSVMMISGSRDLHTTELETRRMFKRLPAAEPSENHNELWIIDGASHVDLYRFAGREYETRVLRFLDTVVEASQNVETKPSLAR